MSVPVAFPGSRIIASGQGRMINGWAGKSPDHKWKLCYSSFTDVKTTSTFHKQCDSFSPTISVAHNSHNFSFGGYVRSVLSVLLQWSCHRAGFDKHMSCCCAGRRIVER